MRYIFLLQCPKCKNKMKYGTDTRILTKKRKRCVYCGFSIDTSKSVVEEL